jgi:hypothetical protein
MKPTVRTIASQPSWVIRNDQVELAITQLGGHMAPVTFCRDAARPFQPYYISPWQNEALTLGEPVLVPLRGDFFCMPFGGNTEPCGREKHRVHGEPAIGRWKFVDACRCGRTTSLALSMRTKVRPGKVTKTLWLVDGQNVVYQQDLLEGYGGAMPVGHHAILHVPEEEGALRVSTSPYRFGMVPPGLVSNPANREYQSFAPGSRFSDLKKVPLIWRDPAVGDATAFPARKGFTDIIAVFHKVASPPAWTTAVDTTAGAMWFALKDPRVLPTLLMWICNGGRHGPPWNGRNRCLGLEDVCGYFADGLAGSVRANCLTKAGVATAIALSPKRPTAIRYIQGVVKVPRGFTEVKRVEFGPGRVTFVGAGGRTVTAAVCHEFLATGSL